MSDAARVSADAEMDAIRLDTERAACAIMGAAERILLLRTTDTVAKAAIDARVVGIFEACSFQDITGQRVSKIVGLLAHIEQRMARLAESLGLDGDATEVVTPAEQRRRDLILNGPAIGGPENSQASVDALLADAFTPERG